MSLREQILNADDIESKLIEIPVWGVTIEVRSMSGRARAQMLESAARPNGTVDLERLYPDMVILCSYDPATGERIFTEEDREGVLSKNAAAVELVAISAMQVSGMTQEAQKEAGKGSPSTLSEDSSLS